MNLLIVSDKADVKLYETVAKTAPNTTVLGAVTKIDSDFILLLKDRYNPHAIMIDTDVTVKHSDIKTIIEQISQEYPYMKVLVLTGTEDNCEYPASCVVQGQVSNVKLKEILQKLSDGSPTFDNTSDDDSEEQLPRRITFDRLTVDNLSTVSRKKRKPFVRGLRFNPIMLSGIAAGALLLFVVVLLIIKSGSQQGLTSSPDEPVTAVLSETTAPTSNAEFTTTAVESPTYPAMYYTTEPVETTVQPLTIAPEPTRAVQSLPSEPSEVSPTSAAPAQSGGTSSSGTSSGVSSSGRSSSDGSSRNSGGSSGSGNSSQSGQMTTQVYGGDPVVSYDNNGRYANQGGNAVSSVKISYNTKTLEIGDTLKLTANVSPANANQSVSWSSSNNYVVSVSNGQITAKNVGTATITAKANNGISASCTVTVKDKTQIENVYLSVKEYHTKVGQTTTLTLYGTKACEWKTSNSTAVRIYPNGNQVQIFARRSGSYRVYAKDTKTSKTYTCQIYVE